MPSFDDALWVYAEGSSNVERFRYLPADEYGLTDDTLEVWFKAKPASPASLYRYYGVPFREFQRFVAAGSRGRFVWNSLRRGGAYRYERVA